MALKVNKKQASYNQVVAAIDHFHKGELDCSITLAAAAEGMLSTIDERFLLKQLNGVPGAGDINWNLVITWLKHPGDPDLAEISEFEAAITISRAITKFVAAYHQSSPRFEHFLQHIYDEGIVPVLLKNQDQTTPK